MLLACFGQYSTGHVFITSQVLHDYIVPKYGQNRKKLHSRLEAILTLKKVFMKFNGFFLTALVLLDCKDLVHVWGNSEIFFCNFWRMTTLGLVSLPDVTELSWGEFSHLIENCLGKFKILHCVKTNSISFILLLFIFSLILQFFIQKMKQIFKN